MMNDCLINQIGLISPPLRNAYLYKSSSELGASAGKLVLIAGFGLFSKNKKRIENG
jgi:hypothetical protein